MKPVPLPDPTEGVVTRIRTILTAADLDCQCRDRLAVALDRFAALERERHRRRDLSEARHCRARIASLLELLAELHEITATEVDLGVYAEMVLLFEDIAASARDGAASMRALAGPEA